MKTVFSKSVQEEIDRLDECLWDILDTCSTKEEYYERAQPLLEIKYKLIMTNVPIFVTETKEEVEYVSKFLRPKEEEEQGNE